jgi:citrate lyase subunit beta/citryl-CoA lyase
VSDEETGQLRWLPSAWMFAPADDSRKLDSALRSRAGVVVADLEDSIAPGRKDEAREMANAFLRDGGDVRRVVRINDPRTDAGERDLARLAGDGEPILMVPKATLETVRTARGAHARVVALVESARGVLEVDEIAAVPGVVAVAIGTIDLSADLRLSELPDGLELLHARSRVVLACAAAGIPAIDGVHLAIRDTASLRGEAERARALGFSAKLCIHPAQLEVVGEAFAPSDEEIRRAHAIVAAYERSLSGDMGVGVADGEMVDLATVRRAERILSAEPDFSGS